MLCLGGSDVCSVNRMSDVESRNTKSPVKPGLVTFGAEIGGDTTTVNQLCHPAHHIPRAHERQSPGGMISCRG